MVRIVNTAVDADQSTLPKEDSLVVIQCERMRA